MARRGFSLPLSMACVLALALGARADRLEMTDGNVYQGKKVSEDASSIVFRSVEGTLMLVRKADIRAFQEAPEPVRGEVAKQPTTSEGLPAFYARRDSRNYMKFIGGAGGTSLKCEQAVMGGLSWLMTARERDGCRPRLMPVFFERP